MVLGNQSELDKKNESLEVEKEENGKQHG